MNPITISKGILRAVSIMLGIALLLYFLYQIQAVLVYLAIAGVISLIGRPVVLFLRRRLKFKNIFSVIVTMFLMVAIIFGLFSLFIPLVREQSDNLSLLDINALQDNLQDLYTQTVDYLHLKNIDIEQSFRESNLLSKLDFNAIPDLLNLVIGTIGDFTIGLFSVLFISFFFLKDSRLMENGIMIFVPDEKEYQLKNSIEKIKDLLSRYFVGLVFQILILFIIYTIVLAIVGVHNAIVIAFLVALLNLIPYIGPLVGAFLIVLLTMTNFLGQDFQSVIIPKASWVLIGFIIGQLVDNFFSQPVIFSTSVKSHPLEIFLIILMAGILFGVVGLMVAIPVYTAIKVILKEFLAENKIVRNITKDL
ncbi:MAG: AI-2E family transporter [Flavobacteriaceae bacterium]|nr:AI-2E family transporter [Flavobacteriaceae bacterium]